VIIYSSISLVFALFGIVAVLWANDHPDDVTFQSFRYSNTTASLIFLCVTVCVNIATILGANIYSVLAVGVAIVWVLINMAFNIYASIKYQHWTDANGDYSNMFITLPVAIMYFLLWTALALYPYVTFIIEVKSGVMSPETYPSQKFSCCA